MGSCMFCWTIFQLLSVSAGLWAFCAWFCLTLTVGERIVRVTSVFEVVLDVPVGLDPD